MDVGRATYPSLSWRYRGARPTCMNHSKTETSYCLSVFQIIGSQWISFTMFQPWKGPPWDNRESHSHITWRCQVEASRRSARLCIEDRFWGLEDLFGILVEPLLKQSCQHHDKSSATSLSAGTSVVWSPFSHPGICKPLGQRKCTATRWFQTTSLSLSQIRCRTFCKPRLIQNSLNLEEWRWLCFGITLCGLHGQRPFASITAIERLRRIEEIIRDH